MHKTQVSEDLSASIKKELILSASNKHKQSNQYMTPKKYQCEKSLREAKLMIFSPLPPVLLYKRTLYITRHKINRFKTFNL